MQIRKLSIGGDLKNNALHYIVGQKVLGDKYRIHNIIKTKKNVLQIWVLDLFTNEMLLWKEFSKEVPSTIEANLDFNEIAAQIHSKAD